MGSIGLKGVVVGGLVAGLVLNVIDYVLYGVVLARDFAGARGLIGPAVRPSSIFSTVSFSCTCMRLSVRAMDRDPRRPPGLV